MTDTIDVVVSRKTARDGRLEIPAGWPTPPPGAALLVHVMGESASAWIEEMPCTCGKAAAGSHVHHFLVSEVLRALTADHPVRLRWDARAGTIAVTDVR